MAGLESIPTKKIMLITSIQWLLPERVGHFSDGPKKARLRRKLNVQILLRVPSGA